MAKSLETRQKRHFRGRRVKDDGITVDVLKDGGGEAVVEMFTKPFSDCP